MGSAPSKICLLWFDFGSTIALDLEQKLKTFLRSSQKQIMRSFLGIYSAFV